MGEGRRICVVTGGRADYGLLFWVMRDIAADPALSLQLIVTGGHLEAGQGMTVSQIEADGFTIDARVSLGATGDDPVSVARGMAAGLAGAAEALADLKPDVVLVLGDRFEILAAAQGAMLAGIPIVHIGGGDVTEGAFDDSIRHALTKLSHIHLVTSDSAARRVAQLGEAADRIHVVGNPGLDWLTRSPRMTDGELAAALGAPLLPRNLLVTFHPVTLAVDRGLSQFEALLAALGEQPDDVGVWITRPNSDPGHEAFTARLDAWAAGRANVQVRTSLGPAYLSLMARVDTVVGNSSSGLAEAPSLGVATVDIGDRQAGRLAGETVIHCEPDAAAISAAIRKAMKADMRGAVNPYGDGHSAARIVAVLRDLPTCETLLRKRFIDRDAGHV